MNKETFWEQFSFNDIKQKSALEYLADFKEGLTHQTSGELTFETEAVDAYINGTVLRPAALYKLFVVAPKLGYFRRKILTVAEYSDKGRWPVDIVSHLNNDEKLDNISEIQFEKIIADILVGPVVKSSIENLYQQSKEYGSR